MTAEEIDIIVEANVEKALKEFQKLLPSIKKQLSGIQKEFEKVNIKDIKASIDTSQVVKKVQQAKKQIKEAFDPNDISGMTIDGKAFNIKSIKGYSKEVQKLKGQMGTLNKFKPETLEVEVPKVAKIQTPKVQTPKTEDTGQANQYSVWTNMLRKYYAMLDMAKEKMYQLKQETEQTGASQGKLASFFGGFKGKLEQATPMVQSMKSVFNKMPNVTKLVSDNVKKMGTNFKTGLKHVLKYAGALFGLQGIYNALSGSAQSWLSSQNKGAQQLSANIEYMKYAMGSAFAPVIEYVISLVYQLMKAIQSVVYAFSGVNIFAKATASSMGKTAKSAKETNKSLAGVHNEINNVSEKDNSSGGGSVSPSMDLSKLDAQMNPFAQKLHDFFKPLVDSWNTYGPGLIAQVKVTASQIGGLIASVWGSFENIITNGTVYSILQNILAIIGNIAEAFSNAWNNDGNGNAIVQNLADAFNNLLKVINNIVSSELFQWLLDIAVGAIKIVTDAVKALTDAVLWVSEKLGEFIGFFTGENSEKLDGWAIIIGSIATAIGLVVGAMALWNIVSAIAIGIGQLLGAVIALLTSPITLVILAIAAFIAIIVAIIVYWDEISATLSAGWEWIKQKAEEIFTAIGEFFKNIWQGICDTVTTIWNNICNFFKGIWDWIVQTVTDTFNNIKQFISDVLEGIATIWNNIWNGISTFVSNIWNGIVTIISNVINGIKNTISNVLNTVKTIWNNIWTGIKNTVVNIWNGIWGCIKGVINAILGGIENMVNGVIKGVNWILSGISNIANAIGGLVGMKPINLKLNLISLPRLAKGNVAYSPLIAQFGEYAGASHNPEITTPQNIMAETFEDVLSNHEWKNNSNSDGEIKQVVFQFGSYRVAMEMENLLRQARRQNGTATVNI